jgi:hypothetical protein
MVEAPIEAHKFPFGQPLLKRGPEITEPRPVFIIGAYPSALHVNWGPPPRYKPVAALAVDNEPEPFWDGEDQKKRTYEWKKTVRFNKQFGEITEAGDLNGSSGRFVTEAVIHPMGFERPDVWITDCLDTYFMSIKQRQRLDDTYNPFADRYGLQKSCLPTHPNENQIVDTASDSGNVSRLMSEIKKAAPDTVVTLGNAALRVFRLLIEGEPLQRLPRTLVADSAKYGRAFKVHLKIGKSVRWLPLAHPAAPASFKTVHNHWVERTD